MVKRLSFVMIILPLKVRQIAVAHKINLVKSKYILPRNALWRAGFVLLKLLCLTRIRTAFSGYVYYRTIITLDFLDLLEFRFCQNLFPNGFEISHSLKFAPYTQCYYLYPFRNHQNFSSKSPWNEKNGLILTFFDVKCWFTW